MGPRAASDYADAILAISVSAPTARRFFSNGNTRSADFVRTV
jgi:hypothetical protein